MRKLSLVRDDYDSEISNSEYDCDYNFSYNNDEVHQILSLTRHWETPLVLEMNFDGDFKGHWFLDYYELLAFREENGPNSIWSISDYGEREYEFLNGIMIRVPTHMSKN